jgi:putative ABC transport system ATP-binding protein
MIDVSGVTKSYRTQNSEVLAVDNVQFEVRSGDFVMILGRSGCGKSTLLGMLAGLIRPTAGVIRLNGQEIWTLSETDMAGYRAKEIGFVFQFSGLIPTLTALENVKLPTLFLPNGAERRMKARALLERVWMSDHADAYPMTLSSGEMKRVAIARALINDPALIIADEPTGDLDVDTEFEIMELFRELNNKGITIIMVTHNPELVPYATRIYKMEGGKVVKTSEQL